MRTIKSTPAEEIHGLIAKARTEMVEYQALGEDLLAECVEDRMNNWLEQLTSVAAQPRSSGG